MAPRRAHASQFFMGAMSVFAALCKGRRGLSDMRLARRLYKVPTQSPYVT